MTKGLTYKYIKHLSDEELVREIYALTRDPLRSRFVMPPMDAPILEGFSISYILMMLLREQSERKEKSND